VYCFTDSYPPDAPKTPVGPANAGPNIPLNFTTVTTDFEGNQIYYWWDWGDGNNTDWVGPFNSDESMTANYSWINNGTYDIRVKAKDSTGLEGAWSTPLTISIAPQISLIPYKIGFIYLKFFHFNNSYFYSDLLFDIGICIVVSNLDIFVAAQTSTAVHSVVFTAFSPVLNESVYRVDDNGTDGFSCTFNITRNVYAIILDAFDANGTFIDRSIFTLLFFLRFGSPPDGALQRALLRGHHAIHH
jgi:hypothetical protein